MSIYNLENLQVIKDAAPIYGLNLTERSIYGSSRVGTENPDLLIARSDMGLVHEFDYVQTVGDRRYELSNHLGNVLEVITDRKLANTHLVGTSSEITVTDAVGISVDGSGIITKTGTTAWNAGGASVETITGDGSVKWTISSSLPENKYIMVGLSTNNIDENYTTIQYAWYARDLECRIYESGANIGTYGGFSEGTNFEIKRTGTTLEYLKDGVVQRTVLGVSTLPFLVDFSMYESGTKIEHLEIITGVTEEGSYVADVVSQSDYYPFGMTMSVDEDGSDYRYSFQGQEKDDEIKGANNSVNYKYRMHDPRVGRFFAVDPLEASYPFNGPYNFSENMVIHAIELEGLEAWEVTNKWDNGYKQKYREYIAQTGGSQSCNEKFTCEDFGVTGFMEFARDNNLPFKWETEDKSFDASSDEFDNYQDFAGDVMQFTGASDFQNENNTVTVSDPINNTQPGSIIVLDQNDNGDADHIQVVTSVDKGNGIVRGTQGNSHMTTGKKKLYNTKYDLYNPNGKEYVGKIPESIEWNLIENTYINCGPNNSPDCSGTLKKDATIKLNPVVKDFNFDKMNNEESTSTP